ncbi:hypothetical protein MYCSP_18930 [Mycobacteroides saopaulense]|nr:hypothetical protein MYCSP_18930 [Mycobacteroides saopaulense]
MGQPPHRIDRSRPARSELWLDRHTAHIRSIEGELDDRTDIRVVDIERRGHDQRREDLFVGKTLHSSGFDSPQIAAAVMAGSVGRRSVVLKVDLHPLTVTCQQLQQRIVPRDEYAIGVDEDSGDRPGHQLIEQPVELRVNGRFTTTEHQHIQSAALASQALIDVGEHGLYRHHTAQIG